MAPLVSDHFLWATGSLASRFQNRHSSPDGTSLWDQHAHRCPDRKHVLRIIMCTRGQHLNCMFLDWNYVVCYINHHELKTRCTSPQMLPACTGDISLYSCCHGDGDMEYLEFCLTQALASTGLWVFLSANPETWLHEVTQLAPADIISRQGAALSKQGLLTVVALSRC